jgi:hypothetical protein
VRPLINGRGTYTILSGSQSLPQVKQAMFEASHYFVQLDEMMDGIGAQLGKPEPRDEKSVPTTNP